MLPHSTISCTIIEIDPVVSRKLVSVWLCGYDSANQSDIVIVISLMKDYGSLGVRYAFIITETSLR